MEFGWALRRPMQLPDSPRHERGLPAALRGVGVKPEVWCVWLCEGSCHGLFPMADCPLTHQGQTMGGFVAELSRIAFVIGFPREPQYTSIHPLSGEFPHQVRLEIHDIPTYLPNMEVTACGGTFEHACEEAALRMMAHLRELHDGVLNTTAYRFHPCRGSSSNSSTFKSAWGENDVTFGHMSDVMRSYDKLHAMLHKATKSLNDQKLVRIADLQDENARLKKEPPPLAPPAAPAPAPVLAPAPSTAASSAPVPEFGFTFVPASAYRGLAGGSGGWLPASPSGGRVVISSSSLESGSGSTYQPEYSRSRSEGPGDEQEDAFDSTDRRSRSEH
uniref:Retrotransposon protein, putative, Ty3-gypsy sub-class n=1 Tax=Oryza sativa subsp. japonica TaxID=39947 RepID=Q53LV6_ORYSJ|nr:retrotransposon protein, putative, Ty3-gypsy sub-class [Oryza sativa Japonica Group]